MRVERKAVRLKRGRRGIAFKNLGIEHGGAGVLRVSAGAFELLCKIISRLEAVEMENSGVERPLHGGLKCEESP